MGDPGFCDKRNEEDEANVNSTNINKVAEQNIL